MDAGVRLLAIEQTVHLVHESEACRVPLREELAGQLLRPPQRVGIVLGDSGPFGVVHERLPDAPQAAPEHKGRALAAIFHDGLPRGGAACVAGKDVSRQGGAAERHRVTRADDAVRCHGLETRLPIGANPAAVGQNHAVGFRHHHLRAGQLLHQAVRFDVVAVRVGVFSPDGYGSAAPETRAARGQVAVSEQASRSSAWATSASTALVSVVRLDAAWRWSMPVLVFAESRDVRVAIGPVVRRSSNAVAARPGTTA